MFSFYFDNVTDTVKPLQMSERLDRFMWIPNPRRDSIPFPNRHVLSAELLYRILLYYINSLRMDMWDLSEWITTVVNFITRET